MKNSKVLFITQTAVFLALLIVFQYVSKPMGQFVTGSLVNLVLISATLIVGLYSGIIVALLSPFLAFLVGIGPAFIQIVPIIAVGNVVLVLVYGIILKKVDSQAVGKRLYLWLAAIIVGAVLKFLSLYFGIVKGVLPLIRGLKEKQIAVISASFSWPQLTTALVGGVIAFAVVPMLVKSLNRSR